MHIATIEVRARNASSGRLQDVKNNRKSLVKLSAQKVVAIAYRRWSFTEVPTVKDFDWKRFGVLELIVVYGRSGRLREVVARGGSTV